MSLRKYNSDNEKNLAMSRSGRGKRKYKGLEAEKSLKETVSTERRCAVMVEDDVGEVDDHRSVRDL